MIKKSQNVTPLNQLLKLTIIIDSILLLKVIYYIIKFN